MQKPVSHLGEVIPVARLRYAAKAHRALHPGYVASGVVTLNVKYKSIALRIYLMLFEAIIPE